MLIELWERLRGYDKWVETDATVEFSDLLNRGNRLGLGGVTPQLASRGRIAWRDSNGRKRTAEFGVDDESPLYQLVGGEAVSIRYNPAKPEQYYFRDLLRSRIRRLLQLPLRMIFRQR
jgi:hypothetical protein